MGAIKDLVDLVTQLDASISDRKTRDLFLPVKEKTIEAQQENFRLERQHAEEMDKIKTEYLNAMEHLHVENRKLKQSHADEMSNANAIIDAFRAQKTPTADAKFSPKTGTWFDASSNTHYCPRCWGSKKVVSPMSATSNGWQCAVCGCVAIDPSRQPDLPTMVPLPNKYGPIRPD